MKIMLHHWSFIVLFLGSMFGIHAQDKLYPEEFPLGEVKLLDGPFKNAMDLNVATILKYDVDRLLAPFRKEAGLSLKANSFPNWIGLDGHVGGHYLSSLAMAYAATGNATCKQRMDYMVSELKTCQDAFSSDVNFVGYVGGVPGSKALFLRFKNKDASAYWDGWVPWYNVHKTYAGLRDAWVYGGSTTARTMFLKLCDWGIGILSAYTDANMAGLMANEHGGMNEVYADAYQMTGDIKYLDMAKKFSHKDIFNSMTKRVDNLDDKHANTQVPKAVGFQRIAEVGNDKMYHNAAVFFWETVTNKRSLALGGNSLKEFFPKASACSGYTTEREGPETCNSNNMLKLAEGLFRINPLARYVDYYERAMYNHILSSQHPTHGGYVYFTPARPRHYRVYSAPNAAMWCCVGTGMENHMKYGQMIYNRRNDSLYVNLYIASELNWRNKGIALKQETAFPDEEKTRITITEATSAFKLMLRHPSWVPSNKFKVLVGPDTLKFLSEPSSFVHVNVPLKMGDVVTILLPMQAKAEPLINVPDYLAIMYGPILLSAKTGTEGLSGLVADDGRWSHIAGGPLQAIDQAPVLVSDVNSAASKVVKVTGDKLTFKVPVIYNGKADSLTLEPFFRVHDSRYMMYWMTLTADNYQKIIDSLAVIENQRLFLDRRTVDKVTPGQQQPEVDHQMQVTNSNKGTHLNEYWRDASNGFFSYNLLTNKESDLTLMVRYWGNESGNRTFDIQVDGAKLVTENLNGKWNINDFVMVEYPLPAIMVKDKNNIRVSFVSSGSNIAGGVFDVRILRKSTSPGELVINGEFDNGTSSWSLQNISGSNAMAVVGNAEMSGRNALRICPSNGGKDYSDIQLQQSTPLEIGKTYVMSFMAKSADERSIVAVVQQNTSPHTYYVQQNTVLDNTLKEYSYSFKASASDPDANIKFFLGTDTSCVYLDKVSLRGSDFITGLNFIQRDPVIKVYPNPYKHQLDVDVQGNFKYQLMDLTGVIVETGNGSDRIEFSGKHPNGIYLLKIIQNEKVQIIKLIKEQ